MLHELSDDDRLPLLARAIVVSDKTAWNQLAASDTALLLVAAFDVTDGISRAVRSGHHVLIPLGRDSSVSEKTVELSRLHRADAREALKEMGIREERAGNLALLARRSLMALRRKLAINPEVQHPAWAQPAEAHALLPALLTGGWSDAQAGDREVASLLGRASYADINAVMTRWANEPDPPVRRSGAAWTLVSKEDSWNLLARYLNHDDLDLLEGVALHLFGSVDPQFDLPIEQRWMAHALGYAPTYSNHLRTGVADTLAIMGARSDTARFGDGSSGQARASQIVKRLLRQANQDWQHWATLSGWLPLLAEAAPMEFLAAVEVDLGRQEPTLTNLFQDSADPLFGSSSHTGLLWALELLAWNPDYIARSALVLARLAAGDPGGKLMNRPANSLREVFLSWHPQTRTDLRERLTVLDLLRSRQRIVAWKLLTQLLPQSYSIASPTSTPKWREWAWEVQPQVTSAELSDAARGIVERLLEDVDTDGQRWKELIELVDHVPHEQRDAIVSRLETMELPTIDRDAQLMIRETLRVLIARHREFPDAPWAMRGEAIDRLQRVYERFEPDDIVDQHAWLFTDNPKLLEPFGRDWRGERAAVAHARAHAVECVYAQGGYQLVLAMAERVEQPDQVGFSLGSSELLAGDEDTLLHQCLGSAQGHHALTSGYIRARVRGAGWEWVEQKISGVVTADLSHAQQAYFYMCLPFESYSWNLLERMAEETRRLYWSQVYLWGASATDCRQAIEQFMKHDRPYAALNLIGLWADEPGFTLPSGLIIDVLEHVVRNVPERNLDLQSIPYHISELLDLLEASNEVESSRIAALEWAVIPLLEHQRRGPKLLHRELAHTPTFFVEVLALVYRAEGEDPRALTEEDQRRARFAYDLLHGWRTVPGTQSDGSIDRIELSKWIVDTRTIAQGIGRGKVGDDHIGKILARAPYDPDGSWPCCAVRDVIEEVSSEELDRGFAISVYNSRGTYTKTIAEGGVQERDLMAKYNAFADMVQHRWPRTATILRHIAESYVEDARREDLRADIEEDL